MCVCVCVCGGGGVIKKQWGYPQIQKSRGSMHAIGCPLALLESSIFPPVTGRELRVLGKKYIKRLLTVNTMYYMKPQKPNLKVMDP